MRSTNPPRSAAQCLGEVLPALALVVHDGPGDPLPVPCDGPMVVVMVGVIDEPQTPHVLTFHGVRFGQRFAVLEALRKVGPLVGGLDSQRRQRRRQTLVAFLVVAVRVLPLRRCDTGRRVEAGAVPHGADKATARRAVRVILYGSHPSTAKKPPAVDVRGAGFEDAPGVLRCLLHGVPSCWGVGDPVPPSGTGKAPRTVRPVQDVGSTRR